MNDKSNDIRSEVDRDALLQSVLSYWAAGVRREAECSPLRWEEERRDYSGFVRWAAMLVAVGLFMFVLWQIGI